MRALFLAAAAAIATLPLTVPASAQSVPGELRCSVQGGFGLVIAANRAVTCTFRRPGLPVEFYTGSTGNIGLDIGPTNAIAVAYQVSAAPQTPGVLQGDFTGPGVGVAGSAGFGGNVLVGASGITLLPIPNTATTRYTGINLSAGLNQLHLQFAGFERVPDRGRVRRLLRSYGVEDGLD